MTTYIIKGPRGDYWDGERWVKKQQRCVTYEQRGYAHEDAFRMNARVLKLVKRGTAKKRDPKPAPFDFAAGGARVEGDGIVIRLKIDALSVAVEGMCDDFSIEPIVVTDAAAFAKDVCEALNFEDHDGTTATHLLFDAAFVKAVEDGSMGAEPGVRCEACAKCVRKVDARQETESDAAIDTDERVWVCNACDVTTVDEVIEAHGPLS